MSHTSENLDAAVAASTADLFSPWSLRGHTIRNRTVLAAMTNKQSNEDGTISDAEKLWLLMRAEGEFGIVTTCAANVLPEGRGWDGEVGVYHDRHIPGLADLTSHLHRLEATALCQIFHGGYRCPSRLIGGQPLSASDVALDLEGFEPARAMTREEVLATIEAFADAAVRCEKAGFDGVEIHGAHTYLITQFLSREINRREDEFGGTLENRYRMLGQIVQACRERTGEDFIVGVRLSPGVPLPHAGISLEETLEILPWLKEDGVDFVHLSLKDAASAASGAGSAASEPEAKPAGERGTERAAQSAGSAGAQTKPTGEQAISSARQALGEGVAIIACGSVATGDQATRVLSYGADGVAVARVGIGNARWSRKVREGEPVLTMPYTQTHLIGQGLSRPFLEYMKSWPGFVEGGAPPN